MTNSKGRPTTGTLPRTTVTVPDADHSQPAGTAPSLRRAGTSWQVPLGSDWSRGNRTPETTGWTDVLALALLPGLCSPAAATERLAPMAENPVTAGNRVGVPVSPQRPRTLEGCGSQRGQFGPSGHLAVSGDTLCAL